MSLRGAWRREVYVLCSFLSPILLTFVRSDIDCRPCRSAGHTVVVLLLLTPRALPLPQHCGIGARNDVVVCFIRINRLQ